MKYHSVSIISLVSDLTALARACLAKAETALRGLVTRHLEGVKEAAERLSSRWRHAQWRDALSWDGCGWQHGWRRGAADIIVRDIK
jgi:hypothetical protein